MAATNGVPLLPESDDYKFLVLMVQNGTIKSGQRAANAYLSSFERFSRYGSDNFKQALQRVRNSLKTVAKHVKASKYLVDCCLCFF
jgi:hypothetical protein